MANGPTEPAPPVAPGKPFAGEWYVAQTLPRKEELARQNLSRQRFAAFLPRYKATRHHARRRYDVMAPLFPGYLFVRFDPDEAPWRSINGTIGVLRLVGPRQARPLAMPASAVDNIMARCRDGVMISLIECLEPGAVVRVMSGPFADRLVRIEALDGQERVRVLLNILGADQPCAVPVGCLGPA
jgi:transcriptional antiterminator RfaH